MLHRFGQKSSGPVQDGLVDHATSDGEDAAVMAGSRFDDLSRPRELILTRSQRIMRNRYLPRVNAEFAAEAELRA